MTDSEFNAALAGALGWEVAPGKCVWAKSPTHGVIAGFSPATSSDDLRKWVLPEIVRKGLWGAFETELDRSAGGRGSRVLLEDPAVLAAAALKVLGGGE